MALYQIIVPLLCLLFILKAFSLFFRGRKTIRELLSWCVVWGSIAVIALFPELTNILAQKLGIKSNINAILFISVGVLFYALFRLMIAIDDVQYQTTLLVRRQAMREFKEGRKGFSPKKTS